MPESTADNQVKIVGALARTYAASLMDLAAEQGVVEDVADELSQIAQLVRGDAQLAAFFASPAIHTAKRAASLEKIFKGQVSDLTYRFVQVVNDKGRLDQFASIVAAFDQLLKAQRGEVDVELYTAKPLDQGRVDELASQIGSALNCTAVVTPRVDESMIGGMKLRIGDKLIDGSVATRLAELKRRMIEKGRESIRASASSMIEDN